MQIEERLGNGGFGEVRRCIVTEGQSTRREFAVKVFAPLGLLLSSSLSSSGACCSRKGGGSLLCLGQFWKRGSGQEEEGEDKKEQRLMIGEALVRETPLDCYSLLTQRKEREAKRMNVHSPSCPRPDLCLTLAWSSRAGIGRSTMPSSWN